MIAPGPKGLPILGNYNEYVSDRLTFLSKLHNQYGDVAKFQIAKFHIHLISHPTGVEWVQQKNVKNFVKGTNLGAIFGKSIFIADGEAWRKQRRTIQPIFHNDHINSLVPTISSSIDTFLDKLETQVRQNPVVNYEAFMMSLAFEILGKSLFGGDLLKYYDELHGASAFFSDFLTRRLYSLITPPSWFPAPSNLRFAKTITNMNRIVFSLIEENKKNPSGGSKTILNLLLNAKDPETGAGFDTQQIRDELVTFLLAGHETTGNSLGWNLYALANNPEVKARVMSGEEAYIAKVIDETLRLYPAAWSWIRRVIESDKIGDCEIPQGTFVMISPYILHRHPEFWSEPLIFNPDRFDEEKVKNRNKWSYIPFGAGPRVCIGRTFALLEMKLILQKFFQRFDIQPIEDRKAIANPNVTLGFKKGLYLKTSLRQR